MSKSRLSPLQKDLFILSGLVGLLLGVVFISYFYSYEAPPKEIVEKSPKKDRAFHVENHLDKFLYTNVKHFEISHEGIDSTTFSKLSPINHTLYQHVFQFREMPPGKYNLVNSAPLLRPAQSYFYSVQPKVIMWTGYEFDWITILFDPKPDSWRLISCFYNRQKPDNPETPGGEKGKLANFTFFPLAEYKKTDTKETLCYSDWAEGDQLKTTLIERYETDGVKTLDSSIIQYRMMVYGETQVIEEEVWRNGKPLLSQPSTTLEKPTFLD